MNTEGAHWGATGLGWLFYLQLPWAQTPGTPQREHHQRGLLRQEVRAMFYLLIQPLIPHSFLHSPAPTEPHMFGQLTSICTQKLHLELTFIHSAHVYGEPSTCPGTLLQQGLSRDFFQKPACILLSITRRSFPLSTSHHQREGNFSSW